MADLADFAFVVTATTPFEELPQWLSPDEAATWLRLSTWTVYEQVKLGTLASKRIGRRVRIPKAALKA